MQKRLLNEHLGVKTYWIKDTDGSTYIHSEQDVSAIIEANKKTQTYVGKKVGKETFFPAAYIPNIVQYQWIEKYGFNPVWAADQTTLRRLLNSNEWRYLRTSEIIL